MITLRSYQQESIQAVNKEFETSKTALLVLPTGAGKTVCFISYIEQELKKNPSTKFLILVNKLRLLKQALKNIKSMLPEVSVKIYCASMGFKDLSGTVTIATIQSIFKVKGSFDIIIADEVHNINQLEGQYKEFLDNNDCKLLAVTATPFRQDGYIYGKGKLFKRICYQKSLVWAIENKFLVPPRIKYTDQQYDTSSLRVTAGEFNLGDIEKLTSDAMKLTKQIDDALPKLQGRSKIVWACSSIRHAEDVKRELESRGELVSICHSKQSEDEFEDNFYSFDNRTARHLTFVSIISEGIDIPKIDAVILMRPTRSPVLMIQTIGRGLRTYEGKKNLIVLDYGQVIENCGPIDNPIIKDKKNKKAPKPINMKFCPKCYEYVVSNARECPCCLYNFASEIERNYLKNLTDRASEASVLSIPKEISINKVRFKIHKSKAGNECLKITYHAPIMTIDEYIVTRLEWRIKNRLRDIFDEYVYMGEVLDGEFKVNLTIETIKEGSYERVNKVKRNRDTNNDTRLLEQERHFLF